MEQAIMLKILLIWSHFRSVLRLLPHHQMHLWMRFDYPHSAAYSRCLLFLELHIKHYTTPDLLGNKASLFDLYKISGMPMNIFFSFTCPWLSWPDRFAFPTGLLHFHFLFSLSFSRSLSLSLTHIRFRSDSLCLTPIRRSFVARSHCGDESRTCKLAQ